MLLKILTGLIKTMPKIRRRVNDWWWATIQLPIIVVKIHDVNTLEKKVGI
jgi:hypothetical protein